MLKFTYARIVSLKYLEEFVSFMTPLGGINQILQFDSLDPLSVLF